MYCVLCILWCILWASGPEINVILSYLILPYLKPASVMAGQSAKMGPVLRGEISNTQSRPLNGQPPSNGRGEHTEYELLL